MSNSCVSRHYRGLVRINSKNSRYNGRLAQMTGWSYSSGSDVARLTLDDNTKITIVMENLIMVDEKEIKMIDDAKKNFKVATVVGGVFAFSANMTEKEAVAYATAKKIENPSVEVEIWKLTGVVSAPRTLTDIIAV